MTDIDISELRPDLSRHRVCIDPTTPDDIFWCWTDPAVRWNGWATPQFEKAEAERVADWCNSREGNDLYVKFAWEGDVLVMTEGDGGEWYEPARMDGPLYPIGAWGWTWQFVEDDAPTDREELAAYLDRRNAEGAHHTRVWNKALNAGYARGLESSAAIALARMATNGETVALPDGGVRVFPPSFDAGDLGPMYVLDVLGVQVMVREREGDVFVHIDSQNADSAPATSKGVVYDVNETGEHEIGL